MLVLDDYPKRQLGPAREVAADRVHLVGASNHDQLVEPPWRAMVREGAEQQVEARQVVAVVPTADLQRQQGAEAWPVTAHALLSAPRSRSCFPDRSEPLEPFEPYEDRPSR